ncbi:unnamed protein product [Effrenium voratum]|nr:unnamed protein product [Effrenium voratum]
MAFRSVVLALAVNLVCADFVYDDKLGAGKSPVLPLGSADRFVRSAYEITRTTTGALGIVGGQHSQLILDFGDQEPMLAIDLHTVRDPKRSEERLDLGAIFVLRIPFEDVSTSKKMNSANTMTQEELKAAKATNPNFAAKSVYREMSMGRKVSEREVFSFLRVWHKLFAHRYGKLSFNCQVMIGAAWSYMSGGTLTCPNCHLFSLPSGDEIHALFEMTKERQHALAMGSVEHTHGLMVDTLDTLNGECGFRDRLLMPNVSAFPSPRALPLTKHQLSGDGTAVFRAYTLGLHHIGSSFDFSEHPEVFRGDLSYAKRAFTSAEHALLYQDDDNQLERAARTSIKVGPFDLALNLGGSLFKFLLNLPGQETSSATVNTGMDLLRQMDLGRRMVKVGDQVSYSGRQRFTYAVTDTRLEIATGGMLDSLKIPLGITGLLSKTMKFDLLSKHNMHAGSRKDLRYAGEVVVINKNPAHANNVELWTEEDEYEMVFDNGSGSYKPYWPAPQLEELLHCNLPDVPGKFSIRVMRGSFGADQATLDAYCDVWKGVDDIPEAEECKRSLGFVAVQPEVHRCCGSMKSEEGSCTWKWSGANDCVEVPGHCCQETVVSQPGACLAEPTCKAQIMSHSNAKAFLNKADAGLKKLWGGRRDECWARQWRTRMFDCFAAHQVGTPMSLRTQTYMKELKEYFESDPSHAKRWTAYLDNLQENFHVEHITLEHLKDGPTNLGKDITVAQCMLPFLNNAFSYVPLSLKLSNFLKVGVYDPSEGRIYGANLRKLWLQYHQYIFNELDYKGESYKTGHDGEEGCGTELTIPRAADEWGNAVSESEVETEPETFELQLSAAELATLQLTDRLGTFEVQCGAVVTGEDFAYESSLSGSMIVAVHGVPTLHRSFEDTKAMISKSLQTGPVRLKFQRVNPGFCNRQLDECQDRIPIPGSEDWARCWYTKGEQACGEYCCCPSGYQYYTSYLSSGCSRCPSEVV